MSTLLSDIPVAILAGGLGTRLRPLTEAIPKALIQVAGKPFLAHQLDLLRRQGIRKVVLCVGYLGDLIQREFGNGTYWGMRLEYSFDGPTLLGTGGAVKKALPCLGELFFVLYGDSYLLLDFRPVAEYFLGCHKLGLLTVYHNHDQYDTSNVCFRGGEIRAYNKKCRSPQMEHIDYGLSLFQQAAFANFRGDMAFDLGDLLQDLLARNQLAGFEVRARFYEIGSRSGLGELEALLNASNEGGG